MRENRFVKEHREPMRKNRFVKEYLEPIVIAIVIALFIRTFIVQAFKIPSSSMEPTLLVGDHLLVNKFIYGVKLPFTNVKLLKWKNPQRGDIIVFIYPKDPSKDFIKRVIAVEGEKVQIAQNKIYINDKPIEDRWGFYGDNNPSIRLPPTFEDYGPKVIPKDSLFVMGDNRNNSQDSRYWGYVNINAVRGKALIIYLSWNQQAQDLLQKIRWNRFGRLIR